MLLKLQTACMLVTISSPCLVRTVLHMPVVSTIGHPRRCGMFGYATPGRVVSQESPAVFRQLTLAKTYAKTPFDPLSLCWTSELVFAALSLLAFASLLGGQRPALKLSRCVKANILAKRHQSIHSIQFNTTM